MPLLDKMPWDIEATAPYINEFDASPYMVYVKTQCTLPFFTVVYAHSVKQALDMVRTRLGRLAKASDFGQIVISIDPDTFELRRIIDGRPDA